MNFKNRTVLVTGGAGFIGSHLVDALVALKADVIVIDDLSIGTLENLGDVHGKFKFIKGDISQEIVLKDLPKNRYNI
jgi:UDP-glucose 4-epimerase